MLPIQSPIECAFPLSSMQREMVFKNLLGEATGVYVQQLVIGFDETLDLSLLHRAWRVVVQRHDVLRTAFDSNGAEPLQRVHRWADFPLKVRTLDGLSANATQDFIEDFLQKDRAEGFAISALPLFRLNIFKHADRSHTLVWTYHHALLDGRSRLLILKEVFATYETLGIGGESRLPAPHPFREYIDWLGHQDWTASQSFWKQTLKGFTTPTDLRVGRTSNLAVAARPSSRETELSPAVSGLLGEFAAKHEITLNTLVQGSWALLLSRYSGERDVVFGATRACRHFQAEADSRIGVFINTLPMRVKVDPAMPLLGWLREVRAAWNALREHEHTPPHLIRQWCQLAGTGPLFETMVVFEKHRVVDQELREKSIAGASRFRLVERTGCPLGLSAYGGQQITLRLEYDANRYDDETVARMLGHLQVLLESMLRTPDFLLRDIEILTSDEKRLLEEINDTQRPYPDQRCIHELFEEQVEKTPDAVAVEFNNERLTYRTLNHEANRLARRLRAYGVKSDDLVGLYIERSPSLVIAVLAVLKAGGAYVPLDRTSPAARLGYVIEDSRLCLLLTQSKLRNQLPASDAAVWCLDNDVTELERPCGNLPPVATSDSLAYVIYTSGSTGKPKGALIPHRGVVNYLTWCIDAYDVRGGRGAPVQSPLSFDLTVTSLFSPLLTGEAVHLVPEEQGIEGLGALFARKSGFSLVKITPAHLEFVGHQLSSSHADGCTKALVIGGENLTSEHVAFWREHAPKTTLFNEYGPTETVVGCCVYQIPSGGLPSALIPIGRPIANTHIHVLDDELRRVPVGVPGELHIGGAGLARGYLNRPELTREKFIPNPFPAYPGELLYKSGDLVRVRADGNLEFLGRIDQQVKVRGYRIELGEIEAALAAHPVVRDALVATFGPPGRNQGLVAYVVMQKGRSLSLSEVQEYLKDKLPDYMIPGTLMTLPALPLTANGKVDRKALPLPFQSDARARRQEHVAPRCENEARMVRLWEELLRVRGIGVHDNFFELGGHSLLAASLAVRIAKEFGQKLSLAALAEASTVDRVVALLNETRVRSVLIPLQPHGARPPFFCVHGIGGEALSYVALAKHFPQDQPFYAIEAPVWDWPRGQFPSVEVAAARYVEEVRRVQPSGPYYLGGYSSGGTLALAMAHQLEGAGHEVRLLCVLDHRPFNLQRSGPACDLRLLLAAVRNAGYWLVDDGLDVGISIVARRLCRKARSFWHRLWNLCSSSKNEPAPDDVIDIAGLPQSAVDFIASHLNALLRYVPTPFQGHVSLHRARARPLFRLEGLDLGWSALAGAGVDVNSIPGSHDNLLKEPRVIQLARDVAKSLRDAQDGNAPDDLAPETAVVETEISEQTVVVPTAMPTPSSSVLGPQLLKLPRSAQSARLQASRLWAVGAPRLMFYGTLFSIVAAGFLEWCGGWLTEPLQADLSWISDQFGWLPDST